MGSLWEEEFPVCCCQVTLPTQPLAKSTHASEWEGLLRSFLKSFVYRVGVEEGSLKDIKQRGWIRRMKRRKKRSIQPASSQKFSLQMVQLGCSYITPAWVASTFGLKTHYQTFNWQRRYSRCRENSLTQRRSKNSRFKEYKDLHDHTGKALNRNYLGKLLTTTQMKRFIFTVR